MGFDNVPRCQHIKINGTQCGSPALRRKRRCFFHQQAEQQRIRIYSDHFKQTGFMVPVLEDANAVQLAIMQVMQMLASGHMDHKTAGLMLYALQTASVNLRNTEFECDDATDVVIDRNDVHRTSIGGPQWFEEDFENDEEEAAEVEGEATEEEGEEAQEAEEKGQAALSTEAPAETKQDTKQDTKHKLEQVSLVEARKQAQAVVRNWVLETVAAKGLPSTS